MMAMQIYAFLFVVRSFVWQLCARTIRLSVFSGFGSSLSVPVAAFRFMDMWEIDVV